MKDAIRAVLVDPIEESRLALQRDLNAVKQVWLAEVCLDYQSAAKRLAEIVPDLVIVAIDSDPEQAVNLIQAVVKANPGTVVLPASQLRDSSTILRVIRAGAREFLTLPADPQELAETIGRLFEGRAEANPTGDRGPQVITVTGAAGGIGCTTLAVNIATTLAKMSEHEVVLADFDMLLGSVDAYLDIIPDHNLMGVIQNIDRLDLTLLKRSITRHSSGLYVLPHPTSLEDAARIEPETLRRALMLLKVAFPTVVIDTSKGFQTSDFLAFEMADVIVMVIQLDLTCLRNTARLLHYFRQFEGMSERIRLVVNRSLAQESEISIKKAEETLKMPISWHVPNASKLFRPARARGVPLDEVGAGSRAHQSIVEIARSLRAFPVADPVKRRRSLFAAFF